jgi:hypothetical protein
MNFTRNGQVGSNRNYSLKTFSVLFIGHTTTNKFVVAIRRLHYRAPIDSYHSRTPYISGDEFRHNSSLRMHVAMFSVEDQNLISLLPGSRQAKQLLRPVTLRQRVHIEQRTAM